MKKREMAHIKEEKEERGRDNRKNIQKKKRKDPCNREIPNLIKKILFPYSVRIF